MKFSVKAFNLRAASVGFFMVLIAVTIVVWRQPRHYEAEGVIKYTRPVFVGSDNSITEVVREFTVVDYASQLRDGAVIKRVTDGLSDDERVKFEAPFLSASNGRQSDIVGMINEAVLIIPDIKTGTLRVRYSHPDRWIAAKMADLDAGAWISQLAKLRTETDLDFRESLARLLAELKTSALALRDRLAAYKNAHPDWSAAQLAEDAGYRGLNRELAVVAQLDAAFSSLVRDLSEMCSDVIPDWSITDRPTVPAENDYIRTPFLLIGLFGLGVAVVAGGVCGASIEPIASAFISRRKRAAKP